MSLFHKTDADPVTFTDKEAVVALLFLVVTADGTIEPVEEELVIAASNRMKLLKSLVIPEFNAAVQKVRDAIDAKGRDPVFAAAITGLPSDLGETVYALAADVVSADGNVQPEELSFLRRIQEALSISDDLATKIIEVMRIKNRG
jgi:tellurite resistance protein